MDIRKLIITKTIAVAVSAATAMSAQEEEATIRVLLMTDGYGGYFHETVDYQQTDDGLEVFSITRDYGNPVYKGNLEVNETENGYLLINEVTIEEYLKSVIPSEMPAGYELEALKAQAICARTYAYRQILNGTLSEYGADVDDSVSYQVYNNQPRNEKTDEAVEATRGMIMTYEGEPIEAFFFSTSSGATSTDEVWEDESAPCLKSIVTSYDENMPWYRWYVKFSAEKIEELLSASGYEIGQIEDIQVTRRSQGGAAVACVFTGSDGAVKVTNEYDIRSLLSPKGLEIYRQDQTVVTDFQMLPSAYFQIESIYENDLLTGFTFQGGGYGHGVGMSQNGANEMAKQGYNCYEILEYYYQDFKLEKMNE